MRRSSSHKRSLFRAAVQPALPGAVSAWKQKHAMAAGRVHPSSFNLCVRRTCASSSMVLQVSEGRVHPLVVGHSGPVGPLLAPYIIFQSLPASRLKSATFSRPRHDPQSGSCLSLGTSQPAHTTTTAMVSLTAMLVPASGACAQCLLQLVIGDAAGGRSGFCAESARNYDARRSKSPIFFRYFAAAGGSSGFRTLFALRRFAPIIGETGRFQARSRGTSLKVWSNAVWASNVAHFSRRNRKVRQKA